jgi:pimeloyl-ACP methyl ester carboxylesterase
MLRLIAALLLLAASAWAAPDAAPFHPSSAYELRGANAAAGALVWLHGSYDTDAQPTPPPEPAWVGRMHRAGYDIWRFDRTPGRDPLAEGGAALLLGLERLHGSGYRHVTVAGHSRGAFIALAALARPDLVEAVAAISPAAHGSRRERHAQALIDFQAQMALAGPVRLALVLLRDDPLDPDPPTRLAAARASRATVLGIDRPPMPQGHMGGYEPAFDRRFGACLTRFLTGGRC